MDTNTINIGKAVRDGLRLKTIDVVALVHDVCLQLDADGAKKLPASIDELSINDAGSVVMPSGRPMPTLRTAVATLLDALIAAVSDEADAVPPALKSLPGRLREAGNAAKASDIRDLLTILRWHLPHDPRHVLRELAIRAQLAGLPQATAPIDEFVDETPAAVPVRARKQQWFPYRLAYSAAIVMLLAVGYFGSRYSYRSTEAPKAGEMPATPAPGNSTPPSPRVVVVEQEPLADAPRPLQLSVTGGAFSPSFEGRRTLLFHAGRNSTGRLFTASLDDNRGDAEVTPLLDDEGRSYHVRLSPDRRSLAFDSDRDGERAVYIADRDGASIERVSGDGYAAVPSWSPDMKTLTFVRAEPGRPRVWNLWQRDLFSGELTRLTRYRSGQVWGASWFPDSTRYAFSHDDRLIIADRAGRETASFMSPIAGRLVRTPAVSPDGSRIIFQVFRDGAWLLDVKSGEMRRILDDATAEEFAWHPDGRHVAYHSRRDGEWRIWVMPA
jgi:Tol biopolymer transport system component